MRFGFTVLPFFLAIAACSSKEASGVADAGVASAPSESAIDHAVHLLAGGAPSFSRFLAPNREKGFLPEGSAFTSFGWRVTDQKVFEHLAARLPRIANEPIEIGPGRLDRFLLRVSPLGARASIATADEGRLVYRDAYLSTDVIAVTTSQTFEEFLLLRDASAPSTFSWAIDLPRGIKSVRFEDSGALVFADSRNEGVMRMPPPFAVDARGVKREANLSWDGHVATVSLDAKGLSYPILLDPALEQYVWEKKTTTTGPGQRGGPGMTFHGTKTLLVGGSNTAGTNQSDTWEWNGTAWTQRCGPPLAACGITHSAGNQIAYHAVLGKTVLAGFSQSWEWNGSAWSAPAAHPASFYFPDTLNYESNPPGGAAPRLLAYGGGFLQNDVWAWNGSWARVYGPETCTAGTSCLFANAAAYDSNRRRLVGYGGDGNPSVFATREFDDVAWTSKTTTVSPPGRRHHKMVYDSARKRIVMFGGDPGTGASYDDTWEYNGTSWSLSNAITKPPARSYFGMAFDSVRARTVLYGGYSSSVYVPADVWEYHSFGGACTTNAECDTGACVDGVCCESSSCGTCQACNVSVGSGTCRPIVSADDADTCAAPTSTCDATGTCKKLQGQSCTASTQCLSSFCVDGVCCASACSGTCQACAAAVKESGTENGICGPAKNGLNPHSDCAVTTAMTCGRTGVCDGAGTCKLWPGGTSCGSGVCDGNTFKGQQCDGTGSCLSKPLGTDCDPGKCGSTGCKLTCTTNVDCNSTAFCDTGVCKSKKANGEACTAGSECQNPFCVDGVCCNKPCGGQCEACNSTGAVGTCVPINTDPVGTRMKCDAGPSAEPCKARRCDGVDGTTCAGYIGSTQPCRKAGCAEGKAVTALVCDGKGNCPVDSPKVCAPLICGAETCKDTCTADTDCVAPSTCEKSSGKCVDAAKCNGDHTVTSADGKSTTDCSPYKCEASGNCRKSCASTNECAGAAICADGVCSTPPAATGDSGDSGGCAMSGPSGRSGGAFLALLLLGASRIRRRRARAL